MVEVKLHDIGEGMTEGDVLTYFVKEGDFVQEDQPIVEMQTEKMVTELTAPTKGVIKKIFVEEGRTIPVGTTILTIAPDGAEEVPQKEERSETGTVQETMHHETAATLTIPKKVSGPPRIKAAPYTRKVARELNVNIEQVEGTGKGGRITVEDVMRFAEGNQVVEKHDVKNEKVDHQPLYDDQDHRNIQQKDEVIPFKGRRRQIAKKMTTSVYTIPHVHHMEEIDMTELLELKEALKPDVNISVAAFFIKALTIAIRDYPIFNAKLDEEKEEICLYKNVHMGMATDTKEGLIVPVIKNADNKSILEIHREMKGLTQKARENELKLQEISGSTFTISNVGPMGSIGATPIINYPEVALMAFHKTKKMPVVNENDEIIIRSMMNVTLTFDHRVIDGGDSIAFTNRFKALLENPKRFLVELS